MFVEEKKQGEVKELDAASKLLLKAVSLIEKRGWCQRYAHGRGGTVCMFGAIRAACNFDVDETVEEAEARVNKACGGRFMGQWNDEAGRTKEEVIAMLRAVAFCS